MGSRLRGCCLTRAESDQFVDRIVGHSAEHGFGLHAAEFEAAFTPCVEIGLATEGAKAVARRAMEKIGMIHGAFEDFGHPKLPKNHPLRRHVLYRLPRASGLGSMGRGSGPG